MTSRRLQGVLAYLARLAWLGLVTSATLGACATATARGDGDAAGVTADADPSRPDAPIALPADAGPDASSCVRVTCDLTPQCGCSGSTPACDLDGSNLPTGGTVCRAAGAGSETTTCTTSATCAAGNACIGGRCARWCATDNDCPGDGGLCVFQIGYGTPPTNIPGARTCSTDCDPSARTPGTCPATWGCHLYQDPVSTLLLTDCDPPGAGALNATCTVSTDCQTGMDCIAITSGGTTTSHCRPSCVCPGGNCPGGACTAFAGSGSCQGFGTPAVIGANTYGVCL